MSFPIRALAAAAASTTGLWIASCAVPAPPAASPGIAFGHLPPIRLDVAEVEIVETYKPPLRAPHVEHRFSLTPLAAMRRWAIDRIEAAGERRRARFVIVDARVVAVPLEVRGGLRGFLRREQEVRYDAALEARVEVGTERGYRESFATARVIRSRTAPEDMTLAQRDRLFLEMVADMMKELNAVLEANIRLHMRKDLL